VRKNGRGSAGAANSTTWQAYGGETTMSYLSQVFGLTSQNFLAGAAGLAGYCPNLI
jgi:K+-transporting ATPase A subunit